MEKQEKKQIKPLCLSFWTPPTNRPQAILIGKMIPEWINQGIRPEIVTYEKNGDWNIDTPVYKIPQFKLPKILNRILPIRAYMRRRYQNQIFRNLIEIIKKHDLNLIFSFANPQESNVIGSIIKEKAGTPFVSHFSDPWYDNPCVSMSFWRKKMVLKQEKRIIKNSNVAIFINAYLRDMVMKKYPQEWQKRGVVIHHSFSPNDYSLKKNTIPKNKNEFVFSYVGVFYKDRNPEIIFQALNKIIGDDKNLAQKIKFQIIGCDSGYTDFPIDKVKKMIADYELDNVVTLIPRVSYQESLKYMQLSDCLIIVDLKYELGYCLPSKIVDYAGSGSVILGVANQDSPVANFLQELGYKSFTYEQINELASYMKKIITGQIKTKKNDEFLNQFSVASTTRELLKLFSKVI